MAAKRALVVDDSKSARAFLSRILERHALEVDSAESAEEAIDYLTRHRPDVIFMDHLMPGMDGFQAVQAIKNNPRTATIPILMYTSQEGELYLGQARALGAIGVLPKQIRPTDVTQVLYQLHLVEDRRRYSRSVWSESATGDAAPATAAAEEATEGGGTATVTALAPDVAVAASEPAVTGRFPTTTPSDVLLRDQIAELRRSFMARIDDQQDAMIERVREAVRAEMPPPSTAPASYAPLPVSAPPQRSPAAAIAWFVLALALGILYWTEASRRAALEERLAALAQPPLATSAVERRASPSATDAAALGVVATPAAALPASPLRIPVPYGEAPLAGDRVTAVRTQLEELRRAGFRGDVEVQASQGRFCLAGTPADGYTLAADDVLQNKCDRIGNPALDSGGGRESLPFANMLGEQRRASRDSFTIRVVDVADRPSQSYPDAGAGTTAGEWNAAATANNLVELRWRERP